MSCYDVAPGDYIGVYTPTVPWGPAFHDSQKYTTYIYKGYWDLVNTGQVRAKVWFGFWFVAPGLSKDIQRQSF